MWPVDQFNNLVLPPKPTPEALAETARLLRELASDEYQIRKKASDELARRGIDAFPGLREAASGTTDAEVKARVLAAIPPGRFIIPPSAPKVTCDMVRDYEKNRARYIDQKSRLPAGMDIPLFFLAGRDAEYVELFFRITIPQESDPTALLKLKQERDGRVRTRARLAIAAGNLDEAEAILRGSMNSSLVAEDYAALVAMHRGELLDPITEPEALNVDGAARRRMTMLLYRARGDFAGASRFAAPGGDSTEFLWRQVLIENGSYETLARKVENLSNRLSYDIDHILAYRVLGQQSRADMLLNKGISSESEEFLESNGIHLQIVADHADQAIAIQSKHPHFRDAKLHLLCARLQVRDVLTEAKLRNDVSVAVPRQLCDLGLARAAATILKGIRPLETESDRYQQRSYFEYAECLSLAGLKAEANAWREQGFQKIQPIVDDSVVRLMHLQRIAAEQTKFAEESHPAEWKALEVAKSEADQKLRDNYYTLESMRFFGNPDLPTLALQSEASRWYGDVLLKGTPDARVRYDKTLKIISGKLSKEELAAFLDDLVVATNPSYPQIFLNRSLQPAQQRFQMINHGEATTELARRLVEVYRDPIYWSLLGDQELAAGRVILAAEHYQRAAVMGLTDSSLMYRLGLALARNPSTAAIGEQLKRYAPYLVLADYDQAVRLANVMQRFEGSAVADAWFGPYTRCFVAMGESYFGNSVKPARDAAEAKGDYATAFVLQKMLAFSSPYPKDGYYNVSVTYLENVRQYHRLRALDAHARKDFPTLADALNRELDNGPPDVETLEKALPALKAADPAAAEKILARNLQRLEPVVEDYPEAVQYREQLERLRKLR
jgi:hypothetical protein